MSNSNNIAVFTAQVNNVIECKLILVNKHIAKLLECVANTPALTHCISDSLKNISYNTEFSRAKVAFTKADGTRELKIKPPVDKHRLVAFVVCLLLEFDSGRRDFIEFLKQYYPDSDSNVSYEQFVAQIILPFKKAGESIIIANDKEDSIDAVAQSNAEKTFFAPAIYIANSDMDSALNSLNIIASMLDANVDYTYTNSVECQYICNSMLNALCTKNPKLIAVVWIGFKNTIQAIGNTSLHIANIQSILVQYSII